MRTGDTGMTPQDIVKLTSQYQETDRVPFCFPGSTQQAEARTRHYGDDSWRNDVPKYVAQIWGVDNFLSLAVTVCRP